MVKHKSKKKRQNDMCVKEIGQHAQGLLTIQSSTINKIERIVLTFNSFKIFTLIVNKIFISAPKFMSNMVMATI